MECDMNVQGGRLGHGLRLARVARWDILWAVFVGLNLAAMRLLPEWQTVPFLAIWVSLTLIYALRLWRLQPALLTLAVVTLATGGIIGAQVIRGQQDADYLVLVPLVGVMFLVMVWHGRRRLAALEEKVAALEEVQRVSRENLRLLERQRLFLLDASHELGTPITVALGHAELIEQAADGEVADDARVVVTELGRLRKQASRMLLLASADGLPTVRAIAEAHHGSVRVLSIVGEGSTFELLVPAARAAAVTVGRPQRANPRFPALPLLVARIPLRGLSASVPVALAR